MDPTVARYQRVQEGFEVAVKNVMAEFKKQSPSCAHIKDPSDALRKELTDATLMLVVERRRELDGVHLQLQNLLYERDHLLREIQLCRDHPTPQLDKMARDEGAPILPSMDDAVSADAHANHQEHPSAARSPHAHMHAAAAAAAHSQILKGELTARDKMTRQLRELQERARAQAASVAEQQRWLAGLPRALAALEDASKPLQAYMRSGKSERRALQHRAADLPKPLFTLFCQLEAYAFSYGLKQNLSVTIVPEVQYTSGEEAAQRHGSPRTPGATPTEPPAPSPPPSSSAKRRKHHHDTSPTRGNGRDATNNGAATAAVVAAAPPPPPLLNDLITCAAGAVELRVGSGNGGSAAAPAAVVRFQYMPRLALVVVAVPQGPDHVLSELFPGDDGLRTPNLVNHMMYGARVGAAGVFEYPADVPARPYRWAQWLAGFHFNAPEWELRAPLEPSTRAVVGRVRARVTSRAALEAQLQQLKAGTLPAPAPSLAAQFPPAAAGTPRAVANWQEVAPTPHHTPLPSPAAAALATASAARGSPSPMDVDDSEAAAASRPLSIRAPPQPQPAAARRASTPSELAAAATGRRAFACRLRAGGAEVAARIKVHPDYPLVAPAFKLRASGRRGSGGSGGAAVAAADLDAVEAEVNAHCAELMGRDVRTWDALLTHQLLRACACLEALAAGGAAASVAGGAAAAADGGVRARRGRARMPRLHYDALTEAFIHR
ncbi:Fms-interacting protein-domain-containing protein [Tribonema minus]|uniref:Fms-interacting protein-domain-containing protein n=1 Tax=Tribonema minus TaxID=303371 RepID=A0A835YW19_9STRA|nr:Fms-interacting protein-domain-containing protein [Tribonema minus]